MYRLFPDVPQDCGVKAKKILVLPDEGFASPEVNTSSSINYLMG
jgi:hypothetical protein